MTPPPSATCWIVTEGLTGTENQCLGVAEALGMTPEIKRVALRQPWKILSPWIGCEQAWSFVPALNPPWPDVVLASGRKSIAAARYIKKASGGKSFIVQIQDPRINPAQFDLVAVPEHDPSRGDNVVVTAAAPNRVTPARLDEAKQRFAGLFSPLPSPRVAVLVGGSSRAHTMTPDVVRALSEQLAALQATCGAGLMATISRRTGKANTAALKQALRGPHAFVWDGSGENPYFGMLAWADYILVTADSVSMLSDAVTTGKPVYMIPLEGGTARFGRFHDGLVKKGMVRPFAGVLESWTYPAPRDSEAIAAAIRQRAPAMQNTLYPARGAI